MIVWGGEGEAYANYGTGKRYDPLIDTWTSMSPVNAPGARRYHTAVWTGTEMIVWGGDFGLARRPPADATTPRPTPGRRPARSMPPRARSRHTAVWTGSVMVVWGGWTAEGGTYLATGGRYDPATDSWSPTATLDAPSARTRHTAVWTGSRMIVWGGESGASLAYVNTGARYDPVGDTWSPTSMVNVCDPRARHSAVWTGTQMIVWGAGSRGHVVLSQHRRALQP